MQPISYKQFAYFDFASFNGISFVLSLIFVNILQTKRLTTPWRVTPQDSVWSYFEGDEWNQSIWLVGWLWGLKIPVPFLVWEARFFIVMHDNNVFGATTKTARELSNFTWANSRLLEAARLRGHSRCRRRVADQIGQKKVNVEVAGWWQLAVSPRAARVSKFSDLEIGIPGTHRVPCFF